MDVIKQNLNYFGRIFKLEYWSVDSFDDLEKEKCKQSYEVCFTGERMVIVFNKKNGSWILPGGTIENGESWDDTLIREVKEESNMEVLKYRPLGVQRVTNPEGSVDYQLRSVCLVEPYGQFVEDPDGSISKIKLIKPENYRMYMDWGEIGEAIVGRALKIKRRWERT